MQPLFTYRAITFFGSSFQSFRLRIYRVPLLLLISLNRKGTPYYLLFETRKISIIILSQLPYYSSLRFSPLHQKIQGYIKRIQAHPCSLATTKGMNSNVVSSMSQVGYRSKQLATFHLQQSKNCFLFLRLLRCFNSPGYLLHPMYSGTNDCGLTHSRVSPFGHPRIKGWLPPPRGLSQAPTSFIVFWCQGIHHTPLFIAITKTLNFAVLAFFVF